MTISSISPAAAGAAGSSNAAQDTLGKDDFLNLLVAQLKHQDPLNPMEGAEFTAQLAQFSSLEQLRNIGSGIERLEGSQAKLHRTEVLAYLGKEASLADDRIAVSDGQADPIRFDLNKEAAAAVVSVTDRAGNPVRIFDRNGLSAGRHEIAWNGCDANKTPLADGTYRIEVAAFAADNQPVVARPYVVERITGMIMQDEDALLLAGDRKIGVDKVIEVKEP